MKKGLKLSDRQRCDLLKKANVIGVGLGYREKEGKLTEHQAVVVFVTKKVPRTQLNDGELVPHSLEGQPVDVMEVGEISLLEGEEEGGRSPAAMRSVAGNRTRRHRPAPGGVSIGHYRVSAGTLGAIVRDKNSGRLMALSNNHVLANSTTGNDGRSSPGDVILQPGRYDGGKAPEDIFGYLERFVPFNRPLQRPNCATALFWERAANAALSLILPHYRLNIYRENNGENLIDAALVRPLRENDLLPEIMGLGNVTGIAPAHVGQAVAFSGRTSGIRRGQVIATEAHIYVNMHSGEKIYFTDQLVTSALSRPGDSGSLLLDDKNRAVGLLFAGSDRVSICNRIENVCRLLSIEMV